MLNGCGARSRTAWWSKCASPGSPTSPPPTRSCRGSSSATTPASRCPPPIRCPAWLPLPAEARLERILVFKYRRKVARDHTVPPRRPRAAARAQLASPTPVGGWRCMSVSTARSSPSTASASSPRRRRRPIRSRSGADATSASRPEPGPGASTLPWQPSREHPWRQVRRDSKLYEQRLIVGGHLNAPTVPTEAQTAAKSTEIAPDGATVATGVERADAVYPRSRARLSRGR